MVVHLFRLPLELQHQILCYLTLEDYIKYTLTCHELLDLLDGEDTCKILIKAHIPYSYEGKSAKSKVISYSEAIRRFTSRRAAFALARPHSVVELGYGTSILYEAGVLCYVQGSNIRILEVYKAAKTELVIDVKGLIRKSASQEAGLSPALADSRFVLEILQCEADTVSFLIANDWLSYFVAVDLGEDIPNRVRSVLRKEWNGDLIRGPSLLPGIKVKHTRKNLYFLSKHRPFRWTIHTQVFSPQQVSYIPWMGRLFDALPEQNLVFKIHNGYVFLLSNQCGEEDDPGSYYQCYRFPINDLSVRDEQGSSGSYRDEFDSTSKELEVVRIRRRPPQATQDLDTTVVGLHLQQDEHSGNLIIVESRIDPEAADGSCVYEFQPLLFPDCDRKGGICTQASEIDVVNYSNRPKKIPYHVLEEEDRPIGQPGHPFPGYKQVTTKHRAYNLSSSAYVDVSFDPRNQASNIPRHQQVHIRIGNGAGAHNVWPPIDAPQELLDFLNPFGDRECTLSAKSDERSIIFIAGPNKDKDRWYPRISRPNFSIGFPVIDHVKTWEDFLKRLQVIRHKGRGPLGFTAEEGEYDPTRREEHAIILVNFDAYIQFLGLKELKLAGNRQMANASNKKNEKREEPAATEPWDKGEAPWFRRESALWMIYVDEGYKLSYIKDR